MKMRILRSIRFLLLVAVVLALPATSFAQFGVSITVAPPELVVYSQPNCPQEGYLWTPGYWAYGDEGYYWVPGTWVEPPTVGYLWTPGYWGWSNDRYTWNDGYWGSEVGFYGGVNYGFGYGGAGYEGGYWRDNQFYYNTYVNNVRGGNFHNTYSRDVVNRTNYVSYNGGSGGITARPTAAQETFAHARHDPATGAQSSHQQGASQNHEMLESVNHGRPAIAATSKPGEFSGKGVIAARGAPAENKVTENKAAATRVTENKPAATRATENRATANKAAVARATENKTAENKAATTRATENKTVENKATENRATPNKAAATRATENKTAENKGAEKRLAAKPESPRPEVKPVKATSSAPPARKSAPPRTESAPKAPIPQHEAASRPAAEPKSPPQHPSAPKPAAEPKAPQQHQSAPKPAAGPKPEPEHQTEAKPKPEKPELR